MMRFFNVIPGRLHSLVLLPLFCIASLASGDPEWIVEEIVTAPAVLKSTDLVLDSADQPHVAFISDSRMIYAVREDSTWSLDTLITSGATSVSLDLLSSDIPVFVYIKNTYPYYVYYFYFDGFSWQSEDVGLIYQGVLDACIVVDRDDNPKILNSSFVYVNPYQASTSLCLHTRGPSGWEDDLILSYGTIDDGLVYNFDLELAPTFNRDQVRVTYAAVYFLSTFSLDYAWPSNLKPEYWNWLQITSHHEEENENALDVDPNGISHCSYSRYDNLYYAVGDTTGFSWELVDATDNVAEYNDVQGDSQSIPHIVYDSPDGLRYATNPGSGWVFQDLSPQSSTIRNPSIRLDSDDNPHIVWIDADSSRVMYACYCDPSGISDSVRQEPGILALRGINPNPAVGAAFVEFSLSEPSGIDQGVFSLDGRLVWEESGHYPSGNCTVRLPSLGTGMYLYRIQASDQVETRYFTVCN